MSAKQDRAPSLGHAELRLVLLLADLERTIETAEKLANAGLEDEAVRLIDLQRDALAHLPEQLAADVATPPRRHARRAAFGAVAAAFTLVASLAGTLGLTGADAMTSTEVANRIAHAERQPGATAKLEALSDAIDGLAALPADDPARARLSDRAETLARRVYDDNEEGDVEDPSISDEALALAAQARAQAPAPANNGSPVEDVLDEHLRGFNRR